MSLPRPIIELLGAGLPLSEVGPILDVVRIASSPREVTNVLKHAQIADSLRGDLWDMAYPPAPVEPVSERAALEICRQVLRDYHMFVELGYRTGPIQDFLLDVESQARDIGIPGILEKDGLKSDRIVCGRYFAASGIWPVDHETFERSTRT